MSVYHPGAQGGSTPLWGGTVRGPGVSNEGPVTREILSVICTNMQFLTQNQHIITKFSCQVSIYSLTFQLRTPYLNGTLSIARAF